MSMPYVLAGLPAASVLCAAVVIASSGHPSDPGRPELKAGADLGRIRASLMRDAFVGSLAEAAFSSLQGRGLTCEVSKPPLANITWRVIRCDTAPSSEAATLRVDVAGRNGVVIDIGVEDPSCLSRADISDPDPEPGGCDLSGERLLDARARERAAGAALLADALNGHR